MEEKSELVINGSGTSGGGTFTKVQINGSGRIVGDLTCDSFAINGSGSVQGGLKTAGSARINGSGKIAGNVEAEEFVIAGSAHLAADVRGGSLRINGSGKVDGSVSAKEVHIDGSGQIAGKCDAGEVQVNGMGKFLADCTAEHFRVQGVFQVNGLLNAEEIDVELYHFKSSAKEIGGRRIYIQIGPVGTISQFFHAIFSGKRAAMLETGTVEGDDIYLEQTRADVVRGKDITLGKGCKVGLVEYTGTLTKAEGAEIGEERKI